MNNDRSTLLRQRTTAGLVVVALVVATMVPVSAQFFGVVFDPTNYANAVLRYAQLQMQYTQMLTTYQQMVHQAQGLVNAGLRYRSQSTPWQTFAATSTYDTTAPWIQSVTTGFGMPGSYSAATERLGDYGGTMAALPPDQITRTQSHYDRLQLTDATIVHALEAIGYLRAQEPSVESGMQNLEQDAYAGDGDLNTQIAVLNKINATNVASARLAKDTNNLLMSLVEQQMLEATDRRDAAVQAVNAQIAFLRDAPDLLAQSTAQTTEALMTFRIP
jgi:hypothetical protein